METLKHIYKKITAALMVFGNIMSTIILSVVYFTIFALFAIPAKLSTDYLRLKKIKKAAADTDSNFVEPRKQFTTIESFYYEG